MKIDVGGALLTAARHSSLIMDHAKRPLICNQLITALGAVTGLFNTRQSCHLLELQRPNGVERFVIVLPSNRSRVISELSGRWWGSRGRVRRLFIFGRFQVYTKTDFKFQPCDRVLIKNWNQFIQRQKVIYFFFLSSAIYYDLIFVTTQRNLQ